MGKTQTIIDVVSILCLAVIVGLIFLTMSRTCEVLANGLVKQIPCVEAYQYETNK